MQLILHYKEGKEAVTLIPREIITINTEKANTKKSRYLKNSKPPKTHCAREQGLQAEHQLQEKKLDLSCTFTAGNIKSFLNDWKEITSDKVILETVKKDLIIDIASHPKMTLFLIFLPNIQKYFKSERLEKIYKFTGMPNDYSEVMQILPKILKPLFSTPRQ